MGGLFGIHTAKHWSGFKSHVGQAIMFISLGLLAWGLGQVAWTYYNFALSVDAPYPSWADAGYIIAVPFWALGVYKLSKATGAKYGLRRNWGKVALVVVPALSIILSYYLLVTVARGGVVKGSNNENFAKLFFDFAYPLGDVIIITLALTIVGLSWKYMGGRFKKPILFILAGFVLMYCADFSFSYTTTKSTFYSGDWVDLLFSTVMVVLSVGIVLLDPTHYNKYKLQNPKPLEPVPAPQS